MEEQQPLSLDYHLRFDSEAAADAVLFEGDGEERQAKYQAIDVIGVIYKPTGEMLITDEGEVPEMAPVDGWHVNVRHKEEAPELDAFRIFPQSPVRVWA
jgi:hypothetical protein